ncbi:MAG TPA: hypothetical protein VIK61_13320 [Acidimicrobiia bacterium]
MVWSLDRRIGAAAVIAGALALAIPIAVADAPAPAGRGGDPITLVRELAALANRGAGATWMVTFAFSRTTASGGRLQQTLVQAHVTSAGRPTLDVDGGLGSLLVTSGRNTYSCTVVHDRPECLARAGGTGTARPGDVYGGAVVSGRYDIARRPTATIAGLTASCFFLRLLTGVPVPGLGFSSEQCYSSAGVPLRSRVQASAAVDERVALTVRRVVGRAELAPVLSQYGLERLAPTR